MTRTAPRAMVALRAAGTVTLCATLRALPRISADQMPVYHDHVRRSAAAQRRKPPDHARPVPAHPPTSTGAFLCGRMMACHAILVGYGVDAGWPSTNRKRVRSGLFRSLFGLGFRGALLDGPGRRCCAQKNFNCISCARCSEQLASDGFLGARQPVCTRHRPFPYYYRRRCSSPSVPADARRGRATAARDGGRRRLRRRVIIMRPCATSLVRLLVALAGAAVSAGS